MSSAVVDSSEPRTAPPAGRLSHLPPLDGIRGLGIPFVLLYHHEAKLFGQRFGGGYLTVSMFFTLSGFLIGRLLVNEHDRTGRIDLKRFYVRRFKRLMPASLVALLLIAEVWWLSPPSGGGVGFWSWFSSLTYWQNWYLIFQNKSYNDLFLNASPVQHMWSLSLEEQVYIVFPLLVVGIFALPAMRHRMARWLGVLAAAGYAAGWFWQARGGPDRAYYALEARSAEFLIGAAFAVWWMRSPQVTGRIVAWMRTRAGFIVAIGVLGLEVAMWYSINLNEALGWMPDLPLFPFWVVVNGLVVCAIMGYAIAEAGASKFLSWRPLTFLGQISYGTYLFHWPVFLFFSRERFHVTSWLLFVIRITATLAITLVVFYLIEDPVRRGAIWKGRTFGVACTLLAVLGLGITAMNSGSRIDDLVDLEALAAQQAALEFLPDLPAGTPTRSLTEPDLANRVLFLGDSQAWALGHNFTNLWGASHGVEIFPSAGVGCGVAAPTRIRYLGEEFPNGRAGCREWRDALPAIVAKFEPQVIVVVGGFGDLADRQISGVTGVDPDGWSHIGETEYDTWLRGQMDAFVTEMTAPSGATILWMSHPYNRPPRPAGTEPFPEEDPLRMDRYNAMIAELAAADPRVEYADLASFVRARPGGEFDPAFRPDGAHIDLAVAPDLVEWIGEEIRRATPPS